MKLGNLQNEIMMILINKPLTRDSDELLYIEYIRTVKPSLVTAPLADVLLGANKYRLASFQSVSRVRRKLQGMYEELQGSKEVRRHRERLEDEFRAYARA